MPHVPKDLSTTRGRITQTEHVTQSMPFKIHIIRCLLHNVQHEDVEIRKSVNSTLTSLGAICLCKIKKMRAIFSGTTYTCP